MRQKMQELQIDNSIKNRMIELLDSIESIDDDIRDQTDDENFILQEDS